MNPKLTSVVCLYLAVAFFSISVMDCKPLPEDEDDDEEDPPFHMDELEASLDDELLHKLSPRCHQLELEKPVVLEVPEIESLYEKLLDIYQRHDQQGSYGLHSDSFDLFKSELEGYKSNPQLKKNAIKKHSVRVCGSLNSLINIANNIDFGPGGIERTYDIPQLKAALASGTIVKLGHECQKKSPFQVTQTTIKAAYPELMKMTAHHGLALFVQDSFSWFKSEMKKASEEGSQVNKSDIIADHSERVCSVLNRLIEISNSLDKAKVEEIGSPSDYQ